MKVADLSGAILNFYVAKVLGFESYYPADSKNPERFNWLKNPENGSIMETPKYSTDGALGMPLIERFKVFISPLLEHAKSKLNQQWGANINDNGKINIQFGKRPLIAAMRAIVASKYGDTVPDEVQS